MSEIAYQKLIFKLCMQEKYLVSDKAICIF